MEHIYISILSKHLLFLLTFAVSAPWCLATTGYFWLLAWMITYVWSQIVRNVRISCWELRTDTTQTDCIIFPVRSHPLSSREHCHESMEKFHIVTQSASLNNTIQVSLKSVFNIDDQIKLANNASCQQSVGVSFRALKLHSTRGSHCIPDWFLF